MIRETWFSTLLSKNNIVVSTEQVASIFRFVALLLEWNKKINLVSRKDETNIWIRHILGSIFFASIFTFEKNTSVLDLGTGGGLPGIPLAILNPSNQFMLLDSIQKKITAVNDMIRELSIPNVKAVCGRAEELYKEPILRSSFDYVVSRGVASTKDLIKWSRPFLRPPVRSDTGHSQTQEEKEIIRHPAIILLKGGELSDELQQATIKLKPKKMEVHHIPLNGIDETDLFDKKIVIIQP